MQTLALEIATTFVDDAATLVTGAGRIIFRLATAPIERLARACDVAGVLPRAKSKRVASTACHERLAARRQRRWRNVLFPLRSLGDLT
ncbi:hypothetical protein [Bradyrhizobium sp. STM 3562]|uniref:hypothetical protein n=1 Tax=Bradyrhizobium sp. STM 3562 TaxID=578924 RepID=UPI0038906C8D